MASDLGMLETDRSRIRSSHLSKQSMRLLGRISLSSKMFFDNLVEHTAVDPGIEEAKRWFALRYQSIVDQAYHGCKRWA